MAHDVFLSYQNEDRTLADRLCAGLESQGIQCWIAPRNIPAGMEWPTAIVEAIGACKVFVMLLSSHSQHAKQISREAELADKQGCQIITFRVEDVEPPPGLSYFLGNIQWLDAFGDKFDSAVKQLVQTIRKAPESSVNVGSVGAQPKRMMDPAPVPDAMPVGAAGAGSRERSSSWLPIAGVIGVAVLGLGVWFGIRGSHDNAGSNDKPPPVDEMSRAKVVAERYLSGRESGQLDAAWAELADTFQSHTDKAKWEASQAVFKEHGHITNHFDGCTTSGNGYFCDFKIAYSDGSGAENKIFLIRDRAGDWKVSRSEMRNSAK